MSSKNIVHGCGNNEYYHGWWSMMQRCYNPKHHRYKRYGGRGISVCDEWHDPAIFCEWAVATNGKARNGLTLERINNDGHYSPDNCRWATPAEQSHNRHNSVVVNVAGEKMSLAKLAREKGINPTVVSQRVFKLGWPLELALSVPADPTNKIMGTGKHGSKKEILIDGEIKTVTQWCKIFGTSRDLAYQRMSRGWSPEDAIKTPNKRNCKAAPFK